MRVRTHMRARARTRVNRTHTNRPRARAHIIIAHTNEARSQVLGTSVLFCGVIVTVQNRCPIASSLAKRAASKRRRQNEDKTASSARHTCTFFLSPMPICSRKPAFAFASASSSAPKRGSQASKSPISAGRGRSEVGVTASPNSRQSKWPAKASS
eukprot:2992690-Pleurochrysis_carterae.AAC.5